MSYFEEKRSKRFRVQKSQLSKNKYWNRLLLETIYFAFFVLLRKARFKVHNFTMRQILKKNLTEHIQRVTIWIKRLNSCQKLRKICIQKVTLWNELLGEKKILLQLPCFSEKHEFKIKKLWIALDFCVGFPKKSLQSINHALDYVSPSNDLFCLFRISLKSLSVNEQLYDASEFQIKK